jgi:hypothetical protein
MKSKQSRGVSALELASARFNGHGLLLRLKRFDLARELLLECRAIFERENAVPEIGRLFSALSTLERQQGGDVKQARRFEETALRYKYVAGDPGDAAVSHLNLSSRIFEGSGELRGGAWAPTRCRSSSDRDAIRTRRAQPSDACGRPQAFRSIGWRTLPTDFADLCATVERVPGVRFGMMMDKLAPGRGNQILQTVVAEALKNGL